MESGRGQGEKTTPSVMEHSSSSSSAEVAAGRKRTRDLMTASHEGASHAAPLSPSATATTTMASATMMAAGSNGTSAVGARQSPRELSILVTQCLQRDFIEPFSPLEGPPNLLHIGELQAYRILGQQPETGPLAILFSWAREQQRVLSGYGLADSGGAINLAPITRTPSEISLGASSNASLEIIHIRDWHDPDDPTQQKHLETFGSHCIQNTRGAELVANLEEGAKKNPGERFVNATGLNDCEETGLLQIIHSMIEKRGATRLRIGVIGVCTDAKIMFLLYDLHSRLKKQSGLEVKLATCSALTGGSSLVAHNLALQQMKTLLNVEVIDSVADFSEWLLPSFSKATNPKRRFHVPVELPMYCPKIRLFALNALSSSASSALSLAHLSETDRRILCFLYRNCSQITLKRLRGGFSGSSVWRVESVDSFGNIQIPSVLKLGQRKTIAQERVNFEMIADILGNNTPQVRGYVEEGDRGGIRFNYAVMSTGDGGNVEPFTVIYHDQPQDVVEKVVKELFQGILWRMYSAAKHELLDLFAYYDFDGKGWSWSKGGSDTPSEVRKRIESLLPGQSNSDMVKFPGDISLYNIARFLEKDLPRISQIQRSRHEHHLVSLVHGDLHGGNILIDKTLNIWLIDFGYAGKGHVLKDITKLENDILYEMTPIDSEEEFLEGITIIKALLGVRDLCKRLPETLAGVTLPSMQKAWRFTRLLRIIMTGICKNERNAFHLLVPLLRYALHSLSFDHLTIWQKRLALAASCMIAQNITVRRRFNIMEYTIEWVPLPSYIPGQLCFGYLPGRKDRTGCLEKDLEKVALSADIVFSFNTEEEVSWFGVTNLQQSIEEAGLQFMATPLVSGSGVSEIREILRKILELLRRGKRVLLIEAATLYRVGMTVACLCVSLNPKMSMEDVQEEIHAIFHDDRLMDNPNVQELVQEFSESLNRAPFSPNLLHNSSSPPSSSP